MSIANAKLSENGRPTTSSSAAAAKRITFENVSVAYGGLTVLDSLNLTVSPGEIVALIGPSGSGKTTALRAVAGFVHPSGGRIMIGDRDVTNLAPYDRDIGMVVQNYALFPHMRVEENVAFGLRARRAPEEIIRARVPEALAMVGMANYAKRYPRELSGGQQQRVAIARAIAIRPQVLLLDEPLSALDAQIRRSMVDELARLHRELPSLTVLYVTHDQSEALTLANHIGIMRDGKLKAFGDAQSLFRYPPNRFAAEFLGRANLLEVKGLQPLDEHRAQVRFGDQLLVARNHHRLPMGSDCLLCARPHDFRLDASEGESNRLTGVVRSVQWQGDTHNVTLEVAGQEVRMSSAPMSAPPSLGSMLTLHLNSADVTLVPEDGRNG
ncbi:2-aminoethylphosphonate ABC transport system ATP-binding subunit PhnT [Rhizobium sp. AC27/96]|uniref:ABC transporter ATP-binding protein n=1 Tax=Rhizobium sp. AC27/96 TaxID=1841653 RepID=UPI00082935C0|nr:ABC transporter ATP-binding protein [Rhizobium sp. AC27/96]OCI93935.1 2-aminoethylphosphonate ABC transport system ATP-binding subunit PhnT [Rhizobium sp. AC27/96]